MASVEKSLLKASAHRDSLEKVSQQLESLQKQAQQQNGMKLGFEQAIKRLNAYQGPELARMLEQNVINDDEIVVAKKHVTRSIHILQSMLEQISLGSHKTEGMIVGLTSARDLILKLFDVEDRRAVEASRQEEALAEEIEGGAAGGRTKRYPPAKRGKILVDNGKSVEAVDVPSEGNEIEAPGAEDSAEAEATATPAAEPQDPQQSDPEAPSEPPSEEPAPAKKKKGKKNL